MAGSCSASGDDGGVAMMDEAKCPGPRGFELKMCVGESSSELSDTSLLASEFTLRVSDIGPS